MNMNKRRIIVGVSGASGVLYGIRTLQHLQAIDDVETHLVLSEGGALNIRLETSFDLDAVQALAEHRRSAPSGLLRVSMPADLAMFTLPQVLADFGRRHPAVEIQLDLSPRRVDLVAENFDLAIRMGDLADDATLAARRVADFATGLVAAPSYLARHGEPGRPEDLPAHHCVALLARDGAAAPWQLERGEQHWRQVMAGRVSANSMGMLVHLALAGAGIAAVSLRYAERLLDQQLLVRVLADWHMPSVPAWAVMPSRRLIPPKTRVFVAALQQALR